MTNAETLESVYIYIYIYGVNFNEIIKSKNRKIAYFCLFCVWQI